MTSMHIVGLVLTVLLIAILSIRSGRSVKNASDFSGSGKNAGSAIIAGAIMGTLVGGSSTVGTAQLAYSYGMSAWWFTLGGGIACLILALGFAKPLRRSGCSTIIGLVEREYGKTSGLLATTLSAIGTFINIISQMLSATAVLAVVFPKMGIVAALAVSAAVMALYVIFGGVKAAGLVGIVKLALLYVSMIGAGIIVLVLCGGVTPLADQVKALQASQGAKAVDYFSVFARGIGVDLGAGLSLVFGVLTTQTYAQAVMSGKSDSASVKGALASAFLIPPIGIGGILVGLYMRTHFPGIAAKQALTQFVLMYMPPILGGVVLGTLFIAVVGTGAGLALGISTLIGEDILGKVTHKFDQPQKKLVFSRVCIVLVLAIACVFSTGKLGDTILNFAFMSMGLRGTVVFAPLVCAIWLPGLVDSRFVIASIVAGPICVLVFGILKVLPFDPLFLGIALTIVICFAGYIYKRKQPECVNRT